MTLDERFWSKVDKTPSCWLWTGATHDGYGQFSMAGKSRLAHRLAFEDLSRPIPEGLTLDHLCRVRNCVNPAHLEIVTGRENVRRGQSPSAVHARKKTCPKGHPYSSDNTYIRASGRRSCRTCLAAYAHAMRPCPTCGDLISRASLTRHRRRAHGLTDPRYAAGYADGLREARADLAAENERLRTIETAASILVEIVRTVMPETAVCSHDREWLLSVLDDLIVALAAPRGGRA